MQFVLLEIQKAGDFPQSCAIFMVGLRDRVSYQMRRPFKYQLQTDIFTHKHEQPNTGTHSYT